MGEKKLRKENGKKKSKCYTQGLEKTEEYAGRWPVIEQVSRFNLQQVSNVSSWGYCRLEQRRS